MGYTAPTSNTSLPSAGYAAVKFLHSSLLWIQGLMLVYVKNAAITHGASWSHPWQQIATVVGDFAGGVASLVATAAAWFWYWGFETLNSELWKNWQPRIATRIVALDRQGNQKGPSPSRQNGEADGGA